MSSGRNSGGGSFISGIAVQILLVAAAMALWSHPLLQPIKLLVVLLHEMSHGLMALATGGMVEEIIITPDEGGACRTSGGSALLIVSAGYLGSMFFGGLILSASRSRGNAAMAYTLFSFLLFGAAVTVLGDPYSRNFAFATAVTSLLIGIFSPGFIAAFILRCVGTICSLYVIVDIYSDILSSGARESTLVNDAVAFSQLTGISASAVGLGWLGVSVVYFLVMLRNSLGAAPEPAPAPAGSAAKAGA